MTDLEAVEIAVARTGVERYRWLCSEANTRPPPLSRAEYLRLAREIAAAPQYPPLWRQAARLARALWGWATAGFRTASASEAARRRSICAACPRWDAPAGRCTLCGCRTEAKIRLATEHCPEGRW